MTGLTRRGLAMKPRKKKTGRFTIREITLNQHGVTYSTFELIGWLNGMRVRKRFKQHADALGEKNVMEVQAANSGELRATPTRLSSAQLAPS